MTCRMCVVWFDFPGQKTFFSKLLSILCIFDGVQKFNLDCRKNDERTKMRKCCNGIQEADFHFLSAMSLNFNVHICKVCGI